MSTPAKPRFTPGPWKRSGDDVFAGDVAVHLGEPLSVVRDYDERAANARLIAASPSLYAYAKAEQLYAQTIASGNRSELYRYCESLGFDRNSNLIVFMDALRATALALAEGGGKQ